MATLSGFKFVYDGTSINGGAVGNIVEDCDEFIQGGLYEINKDNLKSLDRYENYCISYDRKELPVQTNNGTTFPAITYFRIGKKVGQPRPEYRQIVIQGAKDCGLPDEYIHKYL